MLTSLQIGRGGLGRFGNTAFTIAGVIGTALRSGQPYAFPRWKTYDNAIFGQPVDDIESYLVNELPRIPDGVSFQDYGYFWGFRGLYLPSGNWSIDAHMQSAKFFDFCMPQIREVFRFKDEPPQNDSIAIHVRFGDYIEDENAQHPVCSQGYYLDALNYLKYNGESVKIFSDDLDRALKLIGLPPDKTEAVHYIDDFKLMKRCKSFICANSSFSFMAALLGEHPDKKIIMPKIWFGSQMPPEFDTKDIYPQEAIVI